MAISKRLLLRKISVPIAGAFLFISIANVNVPGLFGALAPGARAIGLPNARSSYWASGGKNLITQTQEHQIRFIERDELFDALRKERVTFLDIREANEFVTSHIPNALNIPFSKREAYYERLKSIVPPTSFLVLYCNWDFRAYVAAVEMKQRGFSNIVMMYPHGLRGWIAEGLPVAGVGVGKTDANAWREITSATLGTLPRNDVIARRPSGRRSNLTTDESKASKTLRSTLRIVPKQVIPRHIKASVGDRLILDLTAEEEDHWFVIPDFGINIHLKPGEHQTVELNITRPGYFPFGCITCCTKYQCQIRQAILVDLEKDVSAYGE